ncbi:hypothetical protein MHK_005847 [Candidatus Magnetomorum sp. HK-1]|nr:hypothetical protein MHK_005847 [Candidatus Magnetomorum sp. HK-1]
MMINHNVKEMIFIKKALKGVSIDKAIENLYDTGLSITESIKMIKKYYHMSLREAKDYVSKHPVWDSIATAAAPLHDELIKNYDILIKPQKGENISSTMNLQVEIT